jgi:WD repeat-containing protein 19
LKAYLSSLRTVTVVETAPPNNEVAVDVAIEPQFLALGPNHVAVGRNNHVWFYRITGDSNQLTSSSGNGPQLVTEKEYLGTVESIYLTNTFAAVLVEGKVQLHVIEANRSDVNPERSTRLFPEKEEEIAITCLALTKDFLIYANAKGSILYFYLNDWTLVNEYVIDHCV